MGIKFINNEFLEKKKLTEGEKNVQVVSFDTIKVTFNDYTYFMTVDEEGKVMSTQDEDEKTEYIYYKEYQNKIKSIRKIYNDGTYKILDMDLNGSVIRSTTEEGIIWED